MNFLHRVFHGRVAKARTTQRSTGDPSQPPTSPRSPRRSGTPSRLSSLVHSPRSRAGSHDQVRVNQETGGDGLFEMSGEARGVADETVQVKQESHLDEDEDAAYHSQQLEENSLLDEADDEDDDDATRDSSALVNQEGSSHNHSLDSDEPVPSIESDDQDQPPKKASPFLHGKSKRSVQNHDEREDDIGDDESEVDEEFEEELEDEHEENLLIDQHDLRDYLKHKRMIPGADKWPSEACRLYKLLYLRGLYPLMPAQWLHWDFRDHPMPAELFTPYESNVKILIKAEKSQYHATKALRVLFELYIRVLSYRQGGQHDKIARLIKRELDQYVRWAERDVDLFRKRDYVSPIFTIAYTNAQTASNGQTVVQRCQSLVRVYRGKWARRGIEHYPRLVYIFVVIQHIVLIFAADADKDGDDEPFPFAELDMSKKTHWLDSSLAIAISVMLARQSLVAHREFFPEIEQVEDTIDL